MGARRTTCNQGIREREREKKEEAVLSLSLALEKSAGFHLALLGNLSYFITPGLINLARKSERERDFPSATFVLSRNYIQIDELHARESGYIYIRGRGERVTLAGINTGSLWAFRKNCLLSSF